MYLIMGRKEHISLDIGKLVSQIMTEFPATYIIEIESGGAVMNIPDELTARQIENKFDCLVRNLSLSYP